MLNNIQSIIKKQQYSIVCQFSHVTVIHHLPCTNVKVTPVKTQNNHESSSITSASILSSCLFISCLSFVAILSSCHQIIQNKHNRLHASVIPNSNIMLQKNQALSMTAPFPWHSSHHNILPTLSFLCLNSNQPYFSLYSCYMLPYN